MSRTSEKYNLSPIHKQEPKKMSDYFNDPWCFNLTLIIINGLVILSTTGFLINRTEIIKECSIELFWTATIFEIYLSSIVLRYFLFGLIHQRGFCENTGLRPYQTIDRLSNLKRRFTIHLIFSFLDLLILTPITVNAGGVLESDEANQCGKLDEEN